MKDKSSIPRNFKDPLRPTMEEFVDWTNRILNSKSGIAGAPTFRPATRDLSTSTGSTIEVTFYKAFSSPKPEQQKPEEEPQPEPLETQPAALEPQPLDWDEMEKLPETEALLRVVAAMAAGVDPWEDSHQEQSSELQPSPPQMPIRSDSWKLWPKATHEEVVEQMKRHAAEQLKDSNES